MLLEIVKNRVSKLSLSLEIMISLFGKEQQKDGLFHCTSWKNICICKLDAIGDFILSYTTLKEIRNECINANIDIICKEECKSIAAKYGFFNRIISVDTDKYMNQHSYRKETCTRIQQDIYDVLIQLPTYRTAEIEHITMNVISKKKIAPQGDNIRGIRKKWEQIYDILIPIKNQNVFEVKKNYEFIGYIFNKKIEPYIEYLPQMSTIVTENIVQNEYMVISSGGSYYAKKWEKEKFVELINRISQNVDKILLVGGKADARDNEWIKENVNSFDSDKIVDCTGKLDICDTIEMIRSAKYVICNDTCFTHIAAAVGTQCVCISGGWQWGRFVPYSNIYLDSKCREPLVVFKKMKCYNCNLNKWKCKWYFYTSIAKYPCISKITVEEVESKVEGLVC